MEPETRYNILSNKQRQTLNRFFRAHVRETRRRREWNIAGWSSESLLPSNQILIQSRTSVPVKMAFIFSPYDQILDLTDKSHLKLFTDGCKGLPSEVKFNGTREKYGDFAKLIGKAMDSRRLKDILKVATNWESTGTLPEFPIVDDLKDIFTCNSVTDEQVDEHCRLVWSLQDFNHADSSKLNKIVPTKPTNVDELNNVRNNLKMKHAMLGAMVWDSLLPSYQLEIIGDEDKFKTESEYDGVKLWHYIKTEVNPSTTTGASDFKDQIETAKLSDFGHNIKKFNVWFSDVRSEIIKLEGDGKYNEYVRSIFKTYMSSDNEEFLDAIKAEKRMWSQGKAKANYSHRDVMSTATTTYNNLLAEKSWKVLNDGSKEKEEVDPNAKFLALTAQIEELKKSWSSGSNVEGSNDSNASKPKSWRFSNPNDKKEMKRNERTYKWCSNDCHPRPMWCPRPICMNRADYKKKKDAERASSGSDMKITNPSDFKVALSAICNDEDFKMLEEQFFGKAEK